MGWLKNRIKELLNSLMVSHGKNLQAVTLLDGFESKMDLAKRNLGVNESYFRNSETLTFDREPTDRVKTICPTMYGTPPFVAIVRNVFLIGGHSPIAVTADFKIIYESIEHEKLLYMGRVNSAVRGMDFKSKLLFLSSPIRFFLLRNAQKISVPAVLMTNSWSHYGHWLLEHIIKVRYVLEFQQKYGVTPVFILQNNAPAWQYTLLEKLGIKKEQTMLWNRTPLHIDTFILPSYPEWNFDDYSWLRERVFEKIESKPLSIGPRIYLSRKNCDKRIVSNEDALRPIFEKHHIQIIYPENYSVIEQIEIFRNATLIVGANGSAFANIIFSQKPIVIEFHGREIRRTAYKLSKIMGFDYFPFYCDLQEDQEKVFTEVDQYLYVNPEALERLLTQALV